MSEKRRFSKPPLSIPQQIDLLQSRGMHITDINLAAHYLEFIGYYRLSGYAHYFKTHEDKYRDGTTFDKVLEHYLFDRKLRIFLFDAIERIEVALKSVMTSVMSERYGAFWYTDASLFVNQIGDKYINGAGIVRQAIREATVDHRNKDIFLTKSAEFSI